MVNPRRRDNCEELEQLVKDVGGTAARAETVTLPACAGLGCGQTNHRPYRPLWPQPMRTHTCIFWEKISLPPGK